MRLVYNVYDDENQIESKQFDNFPEALEYAKQGLITYICEEDLDCPDCDEKVVWTWDSTWDDEEAITRAMSEESLSEEENYFEFGSDLSEDLDLEISVSGPTKEVKSLIDLVFDDSFDLDWDTPVERTNVEVPNCTDDFGYEDEPTARDVDFDVDNPFEDNLFYSEREYEEDDFEIGEPEIVEDPEYESESEESQDKKLEVGEPFEDPKINPESEDSVDKKEDKEKLVEETDEDLELEEPEEDTEEVEEILTTVEEIKEIAAEAGEEVAEVVKENPEVEGEEIKEITDEVVRQKLEEPTEEVEEVVEDEISEEENTEDEEVVEESLTEHSDNLQVWDCWFDDEHLGTVRAATEHEARCVVANNWPEYNHHQGHDKGIWVEPSVEKRTDLEEGRQPMYSKVLFYYYTDGNVENRLEKYNIVPKDIRAEVSRLIDSGAERVYVSKIVDGQDIPLDKYTYDPEWTPGTPEYNSRHFSDFALAESVSQEISSAYKQLSKTYGKDIEELVYGVNGFMATKYPNGLPDFSGDIIYSDKYWAEFEQWLEENHLLDESCESYSEDLEDDLTDQEFVEQLKEKLIEVKKDK